MSSLGLFLKLQDQNLVAARLERGLRCLQDWRALSEQQEGRGMVERENGLMRVVSNGEWMEMAAAAAPLVSDHVTHNSVVDTVYI